MQLIIIVVLFVATINGLELIEEVDDNFETSLNYLITYGYLNESTNALNIINSTSGEYVKALKNLQKYNELEATGLLDSNTINLISKERCGVADSNHINTGRWNVSPIKWLIYSANPNEIYLAKAAFDIWGRYANITFEQLSYTDIYTAHIIIANRAEKHRPLKGYTFCSRFEKTTLGHAEFPTSGINQKAVEIHMNNVKSWDYSTSRTSSSPIHTVSYFLVLVHEIGHSLGIHHVRNPMALMAPTYRDAFFSDVRDYNLSSYDIEEIQALYGKKDDQQHQQPVKGQEEREERKFNTPAPAPVASPLPPNLCDVKNITKVFLFVDKVYLIYKEWLWVKSVFEEGYPKPILLTNWLPGLNITEITCVYSKPGVIVVVIHDNFFYIDYPEIQNIKDRGSVTGVHKISAGVYTNLGKTYIFHNGIYVLETNDDLKMLGNSTVGNKFPGIPDNVEGVFQHVNGFIYFINNHMLYEYSEYQRGVRRIIPFDLSFFNIFCSDLDAMKKLTKIIDKLTYMLRN